VRKAGISEAVRLLSSFVAFLNHQRHWLGEILLYPPDARRRDIDNYNKACLTR
jgi:Holliday junction resolvase RusA-like endonuclease